MKYVLALSGMALAMHAGFVLGQPVATTSTDPIVVTATRTPRTVDESLAATTVITREEIALSQAKDVVELLRFQAGLDIARNGGLGQAASVFTRGTDSNHTLVLVDGVRINPGTIGGAPFQFLDPSVIDRIEIVRGPRSTLYGSDAIGGVIQIFTRRADKGTSARVMGGAGTDETREGAIGVHHGSERWRAGIDVSTLRTDGFPSRTQSTIDRGSRNTSINAYAGTKIGRADVEVSRWEAQGNVEYLSFALAPLDQDFDNSVTAATLRMPLTSKWTTTLQLSRLQDKLEQNQSADFIRTERDVLDWQNDVALSKEHLLTVGALISDEQTRSLSTGTGFDVDTDTSAIFVQDLWTRGSYRLLGALRYTDHEGFGSHTTGELATGFDISPEANVYASIGTAFRAPDSTDRFGFGGNPNLDPETSRNVEIGTRLRLSSAQTVRFALFQNDIDDLIVFVDPDGFSGPIPGMVQNVEEARIRGFEAGYRFRSQRWILDANGIVQDPLNRDSGKQLPRRAKRSLTLNARYRVDRYTLGAGLLATSERPDSDFNNAVNAGYGIVSLFAQYEPIRQIRMSARIENLFDKDYELANGFNTQGRSYFFSVSYQLSPAPAP